MKKLTIIMYHYVREIKNSKFPNIKGLEVSLFKEQIRYLKKHYVPITVEEVLEAAQTNIQLPENAALLTFDDGYIDHFQYVFPILKKNGIQGAFYAPVQAITKHKVLDVNKIHFILASARDTSDVVKDIFALLDANREQYALEPNKVYYKKLALKNRFDTAETIFIKRLLQVELEVEVREIITNILFTKYLETDEASFSKTIYMNKNQLLEMVKAGMHVGVHGYRHEWLGHMSKQDQENEIQQSVNFLDSLGIDQNLRTICYPYGDYNDTLLDILKIHNVQLGMTAKVDVADLEADSLLMLPRIDTNDLSQKMNISL